MTIQIQPNEAVCGTCKHYMQHYHRIEFQGEKSYTAVNCGHCTCPRLKGRPPGHEACFRWEQKNNK